MYIPFVAYSRAKHTHMNKTDAWLDSGLTAHDWALLKAEAARPPSDTSDDSSDDEEDAMDTGRGTKGVFNPVERHVFAPRVLLRREEELGRLKATCLPEMVALLHQVIDYMGVCGMDVYM